LGDVICVMVHEFLSFCLLVLSSHHITVVVAVAFGVAATRKNATGRRNAAARKNVSG